MLAILTKMANSKYYLLTSFPKKTVRNCSHLSDLIFSTMCISRAIMLRRLRVFSLECRNRVMCRNRLLIKSLGFVGRIGGGRTISCLCLGRNS